MNRNNALYKNFKLMLDGYKNKTYEGANMFESGLIGLMSLEPENPFEKDTPVYDLFYKMQLNYKSSLGKEPGCKYRGKQLIQQARELCELKVKNPYKFDKKAEEEEKLKQKEEEEKSKRILEEREQKRIEEMAIRAVAEEQRKKQTLIQNEIAKARAEAQRLDSIEREKKLQAAIEKERLKYSESKLEEEETLAALLKSNEERKATLSKTEEPKIAPRTEPKIVLGVPDEPKKSLFKRLFHRE